MSINRILELPELTSIDGSDMIPLVDDNEDITKRVLADTFYSYVDTVFITPFLLPNVSFTTRNTLRNTLRDTIDIDNSNASSNTARFLGNFYVDTSSSTIYTISYSSAIICSMFLISSVGSNGGLRFNLTSSGTSFNDGSLIKTASNGEYLWCVLSPNDGKIYVINTSIP